MDKEFIKDRLPHITNLQLEQLEAIIPMYIDWNSKINVVSRKDIDKIYEHHILHSLSIAMQYNFKDNTSIVDLGTGGGFPGIPLAIMFPNVKFKLIDGTAKKIRVVNDIINQLGLKNVVGVQVRAEELREKFDFVVTRAVAKIDKLKEWGRPLIKEEMINALPNGIIALKGGDIEEELKLLSKKDFTDVMPLGPILENEYFDEKYLVYLQV